MRKTTAVLASLSFAALALTGCTVAPSFDGSACDRDSDATALQESVTVEGDLGGDTDVEIFSPLNVKSTKSADLIVGDGRALTSGGQNMIVQLEIYDGNTGEKVFDLPYEPGATAPTSIDYWTERSPGIADVLKCATEGSRVVAALTPEDFGAQNVASFGMESDASAVLVFDLVEVFPTKAEGALQFNDAQGLPSVVRAPDGTPGVIIPRTEAPKEQSVQTLIAGEGEKLTAAQTPLVNFTALSWEDDEVLYSTWGEAPALTLNQMAPPIAEALIGQTVGSQVLVVVPQTETSPSMVFVVDILGAVTVATQ